MSNRAELSRRFLLKVVGGAGASFVLGGFASIACANPTELDGSHSDSKSSTAFAPNAFVKVDSDGVSTITITRSDMGQGVRTSLAMFVAEEMDLDWKKVTVVQAAADPKVFGRQGTGGSSSIRSMNEQLRKMGATARAMLVSAAAKQWGVLPETCRTEAGKVIHTPSGRSISYGELTVLAGAEPVPTAVKLKDKADYKIVGTAINRVDNSAVVRGTAIYGLDAKVEGMAYAVIARPPSFGGSIQSVDDGDARKVPNVIDVIQLTDSHSVITGVAVLANNTWAALSGREALKIQWNEGPNASVNTANITEKLKSAMIDHPAIASGVKVVEASFDFPFLAHATMEPMNAVADVRGDHCTVWAPTQVPDGAVGAAARAAGLPTESISVNTTLLGGGFGRRLQTDFIEEAVHLSKLAKMPVKLIWSREDDMKHDFYRPACHSSLKAGLDSTGNPVAWSHQAIQAGWGGKGKFGPAEMFYEVPDATLLFGGVSTPVPPGAWRSVENTLLNVANECFVDEVAHAAGKDPFEFRKSLIKDERLRNVLVMAAEKAGWGKPLPSGHALGIACFSGYGTRVAHVVELSVVDKSIKLHKVVAVVDCGFAVNPKGVEAQIHGACVDGLSTALRAEITIEKGGVEQNSWTDYRWMSMDAMPKIEVHIISGSSEMGGMGEPGYPSVPPAVANAVFAATGKRVRKFPIRIEELAS